MASDGGGGGVFAPAPHEAQRNVDFLCNRFSVLFAQLHREEAAAQAANERNALLEKRLQELRSQGAVDEGASSPREEEERFAAETARLRREVEAAEQRAALGDGEASALADAVATYGRQASRLRERLEEEANGERAAGEQLRQRSDELRELQQRRAELGTALQAAEDERLTANEELSLAARNNERLLHEVSILEHRVKEEKAKSEGAEAEACRQRDDMIVLEHKLGRTNADLEELTRRLEHERAEGRQCEDAIQEQVTLRVRAEEELKSLAAQLEEQRRDGADRRMALNQRTLEVQRLRERLREEQQLQRQEHEAAASASQRLAAARAELAEAERQRADAESELQHLKGRASEMEEKCSAQREWRNELRHKQSSSEVALERLREELRMLSADRARLQREVDEVAHERARLEVELQVATPALQEVMRRSQDLEDRLAVRVRELADEAEKVRRYRAEADSVRSQAEAMEQRTATLSVRARELQNVEAIGPPTAVDRHAPSPGTSVAAWRDLLASVPPVPTQPPVPTPQPQPQPQPTVPPLPGAGTGADVSFGAGGAVGLSALRDLPLDAVAESDDAVRFLCEFVAREEERLGLAGGLSRGRTAFADQAAALGATPLLARPV